MTVYNIWRSTLVGSNNDTALALAHSSTLSHEQFVAAMNVKAKSMGLTRTHFVDPTGLSAQDVSSAEDLARIARAAFSRQEIVEATTMTEHVQETVDAKFRTVVRTTNTLLFDKDIEVTAGKTGFIDEAGYCVVERVQVPGSKRNVIVVVLGTESDTDRFSEAKKLSQWAFAHFIWQ
jgi:D-alanyl-D-alanine endopeptidase (penicillin-binding protein 7)